MGSLGDEPVSKENHDLKREVHKAEESATQVHEPEAGVQDVDIQSTEQGQKGNAPEAPISQEVQEDGAQEAKGQETRAQEADAPKSSVQETEVLKSEAQEAEAPESSVQETEASKSEAQEVEVLKSSVQEAEAPKIEAQEAEAPKSEAQETEAQEPETQDAEAQEAELQEPEAQEADAQEPAAQEAEVQEPEAQETGTSTTQNPNGVEQAGKLEQNVAATGDRAAPNGRRKLPEVKRFSARRSVVATEDSKPAVESGKSASIARKQQQRLSARMNMGIDDRDTVDYSEDLKPVAVVVKEALAPPKQQLSVPERERLRLKGITRNKDIVCLERIRGKLVNITQGLELHTGVFSRVEQNRLVDLVRELQAKGRRQELKDRTYSEPRKWMRGKGRVTLQFGCCYNYAVDKNGNPPGILRDDVVDPIPPLLRTTIKRLIRWHVLPPSCVPDSCIINMYEEGDCIPPHIDHHDFLRPFCTLSLLSECNIVFGANLEVLGPGDFGGNLTLPLPVGSVLVLNGNGADVAKHAVPAVPTERISITFRKMDPSKVPVGFTIDTELQSLKPVSLPS